MSPARRHPLLRPAGAFAALAVVALLVAGCRPDPGPAATTEAPSPSPTASQTVVPSPSPVETNTPDAGFQLPAKCEDIYSPAMLASLNASNPPLNDPGVTMHASQNAAALELLNSGIPTLRCSWGKPSEYGLATNVSVVDAAAITGLVNELTAAGFGCQSVADGTLCEIEQRTVDLDDNEVTLGESHYFRGFGWVSTAWINFDPDGYTEDIVATLWG